MENNAEIVGRLRSGEPEVVEAAVREVREKGDLEVAAAICWGVWGELGEGRLATTVCNLLADVRDSRFRALLMERLEASRDEGGEVCVDACRVGVGVGLFGVFGGVSAVVGGGGVRGGVRGVDGD